MKRLFGMASLALAVSLSTALILLREEPQAKTEVNGPIAVSFLAVAPQTVTDIIVGYGQVRPRWETTLTSEVSGRVVAIPENFLSGSAFSKGDVLTAIDRTSYKAALAKAKSDLAKARRVLREEEQRSEIAKKNWNASGIKGDPSDLALRLPQLKEAQAVIDSALAAVRNAKYELSRTRIAMPYNGIVTERNVNPGDVLRVGDPIGKIYDTTVFEVAVPLTMDQIDRIGPDHSEARVVLTSQRRSRTWKGKVSRVERTIDTQNRWQNLIVEIRETEGLLPGQFLTAEISGKSYESVIAVPESMPSEDGRLWIIDRRDRLKSLALEALFRKDGNLYFALPHNPEAHLRVTAGRRAYLPGVKVTPLPAADPSAAAGKVAARPR